MNLHLQRKRKLNITNEESSKAKNAKFDTPAANAAKSDGKENEPEVLVSVETLPTNVEPIEHLEKMEIETIDTEKKPTENNDDAAEFQEVQIVEIDIEQPKNPNVVSVIEENVESPLRRGSQESTATTTTQTTTTTSTDSTSSSSDSSSSTDSSSDSDDSSSEEDSNKVKY